MGRKKRQNVVRKDKHEKKDTTSMPFNSKCKLNDLVDELLRICSVSNKEWSDYIKIYEKTQEIQELEQAYILPNLSREEHFDEFHNWLSQNGAIYKNVEIGFFETTGYGIKAKQCIKENELWLSVPRKLMMTADSASKSELKNLIEKDPLLQHMPNVCLALHLLNERCNENSFWQPYIATLPDLYDTPMYFTPEELEYLKGSCVLECAIKQCENVARQYAYFYKLLQKLHKNESLSLSRHFTYDSYRWCVSAVMTRQNSIPSSDGSTQLLALVPMWDMCNHTNGKLSTDFNIKNDQLESYAFRNFEADEQLFIFYGARPNSELMVHNGFVYPDNPFDSVEIYLELRKSDLLYERKAQVLAKLNLTTCGKYSIFNNGTIDGNLLAFSRIGAMNEDVLQSCVQEDTWRRLTDVNFVVDDNVERICWKLLHTRIQHLLNTCPQKVNPEQRPLSSRTAMAILLRQSEEKILQAALQFVIEKKSNNLKPTPIKKNIQK